MVATVCRSQLLRNLVANSLETTMGLTTVDDLLGLLQGLNVSQVLRRKLMVVTAGSTGAASTQVLADEEARARLVAMRLNSLSHQASPAAVGSARACTGHDGAQRVATECRSLTRRSSLLADGGMAVAYVGSSTSTLTGATCAVRQVHGLLADATGAASETCKLVHRWIG